MNSVASSSPRARRQAGASGSAGAASGASLCRRASNPNSWVMTAAVSKSICWLMLAITPLAMSCLITSMGLTCISSAKWRTVSVSGSSTTLCPLSLIPNLLFGPRPFGVRKDRWELPRQRRPSLWHDPAHFRCAPRRTRAWRAGGPGSHEGTSHHHRRRSRAARGVTFFHGERSHDRPQAFAVVRSQLHS